MKVNQFFFFDMDNLSKPFDHVNKTKPVKGKPARRKGSQAKKRQTAAKDAFLLAVPALRYERKALGPRLDADPDSTPTRRDGDGDGRTTSPITGRDEVPVVSKPKRRPPKANDPDPLIGSYPTRDEQARARAIRQAIRDGATPREAASLTKNTIRRVRTVMAKENLGKLITPDELPAEVARLAAEGKTVNEILEELGLGSTSDRRRITRLLNTEANRLSNLAHQAQSAYNEFANSDQTPEQLAAIAEKYGYADSSNAYNAIKRHAQRHDLPVPPSPRLAKKKNQGQEVLQALAAGESVASIAKRLNVGKGLVYYYRQYGADRTGKFSKEEVALQKIERDEKILKYAWQGLPIKKIAELMKLSDNTVGKVLKGANRFNSLSGSEKQRLQSDIVNEFLKRDGRMRSQEWLFFDDNNRGVLVPSTQVKKIINAYLATAASQASEAERPAVIERIAKLQARYTAEQWRRYGRGEGPKKTAQRAFDMFKRKLPLEQIEAELQMSTEDIVELLQRSGFLMPRRFNDKQIDVIAQRLDRVADVSDEKWQEAVNQLSNVKNTTVAKIAARVGVDQSLIEDIKVLMTRYGITPKVYRDTPWISNMPLAVRIQKQIMVALASMPGYGRGATTEYRRKPADRTSNYHVLIALANLFPAVNSGVIGDLIKDIVPAAPLEDEVLEERNRTQERIDYNPQRINYGRSSRDD